MSWDAYVQYAYDNPAHIAIAPLLPTPFNQARSVVKLLDCASLGAAGVFAQHDVYVPHLRTHANAILINQPSRIAWFEAITQLVSSSGRNGQIAHALLAKVKTAFGAELGAVTYKSLFLT